MIAQLLKKRLSKLPSRRPLSPSTVKLDMATMCWWRHCMAHGMDLIGSLVADSSEQKAYNYMLSRFEYVSFSPEWTVQQRLAHNWSTSFVPTTLSSALLGYGEATFTRKFLAMWHVMQMKTGTDACVDKFRKCIVGCCTDQALNRAEASRRPKLAQTGGG